MYNSVAILVASLMLRQSMSQNRAETVVVNDTQSLTNVKGVDPVTSSHCARVVPPNFQGDDLLVYAFLTVYILYKKFLNVILIKHTKIINGSLIKLN